MNWHNRHFFGQIRHISDIYRTSKEGSPTDQGEIEGALCLGLIWVVIQVPA